MNEAETGAEHIDPALKAAGWGVVEGSRVLREHGITLGRLLGSGVRGARAKAEIADYVLVYRNTKLAVIEAKVWDKPYTDGVGQAIYGIDMATGIACSCVHIDSQFNVAHCLEHPMATKSVGIREFRSGLADYIASETPVAITRHGQTVGFFIPTKSRAGADRAALKKATADMDRLRVAGSEGVSTVASDVEAGGKTGKRAAGAGRRQAP